MRKSWQPWRRCSRCSPGRGRLRRRRRQRRRQRQQQGRRAPNTGAQGKKGGTLTVMSLGDVDSLDPGYWYYQTDYMDLAQPTQRHAVRVEADDDTKPTPDLADGAAAGLRRRQDAHDQDQARHQVQPAAPGPDGQGGGHQVRDGALLPAAGRQRLRGRLLLDDIEGAEGRSRTARPTRSRASRRPTTRRSSSSSTEPTGVARRPAARWRCRCTIPVPKDYAAEVRQGQAVDVRRAPGVHRPVHDPERRLGQAHRLRRRASR